MSFLNIAHRGASIDAPENTLEAFRLAVAQGADMIETDLHLTRDRALPLCHDHLLDGVEIGGLTLADVRERVPTVPTLEEALDLIGDRIPFNLELKHPSGGEYEGLEARVLEEVRARRLVPHTLFSSFHHPALLRMRQLEPDAHIGLLVRGDTRLDIAERAADVGAEAVHLPQVLATEGRLEELHARGFRVYVFTVDDPDDQRRLLSWGVDGLFTNTPARLRTILADRESPTPPD